MAKIATSARGEKVDFDLLNIKQQLLDSPPSVKVESRRAYIDKREGNKLTPEQVELLNKMEEKVPEELVDTVENTDESTIDGTTDSIEDTSTSDSNNDSDPFDIVNG